MTVAVSAPVDVVKPLGVLTFTLEEVMGWFKGKTSENAAETFLKKDAVRESLLSAKSFGAWVSAHDSKYDLLKNAGLLKAFAYAYVSANDDNTSVSQAAEHLADARRRDAKGLEWMVAAVDSLMTGAFDTVTKSVSAHNEELATQALVSGTVFSRDVTQIQKKFLEAEKALGAGMNPTLALAYVQAIEASLKNLKDKVVAAQP